MILNDLKECLKSEKKDKTIFDIILYGSTVKGTLTPHDLDILVIFHEGTLKERLERIQSLKKKIILKANIDITIDIKTILLEELFSETFFARSGIFLEGISLFDGKPFSHKISFEGHTIFIYNLQNKTHTEKVKINYILSGRGQQGIIKLLKGKHLAPGVVQIPIKNSLEFEDILKRHMIKYSQINVLIQR